MHIQSEHSLMSMTPSSLFPFLLTFFCSLSCLTLSQTPTSAPTPDCDTLFISISSWDLPSSSSIDESSFTGTFSKSSNELILGRPVWNNYVASSQQTEYRSRLYYLNDWVIENDIQDYLTYIDSDSLFPPINGIYTFVHGNSNISNAELLIECSDSYVPSAVPSNMPSNIPSGVPSNNPSYGPSTIPSIMPSNNPSTVPSNQPTASPTLECSVITMTVDEDSLVWVNDERRRRRRGLSSLNNNGNNGNNINKDFKHHTKHLEALMNKIDNDNNNNDYEYIKRRGLLSHTDDEELFAVMNEMLLTLSSTEVNNRALFELYGPMELVDEYEVTLSYINSQWTLIITDLINNDIIQWNDTSGDSKKLPPLDSSWQRYYNDSSALIQLGNIDFECYTTMFPSSIPSNEPSCNPSSNPSNAPTYNPTEPSIAPTIAPTEECDEITVNIIDTNYNDTESIIHNSYINGVYIKQASLVNNRVWFQNEMFDNDDETGIYDIWIEFNNDAWFILNPNENNDDSLNTLYFNSLSKEPPIDNTNSANAINGSWWISNELISTSASGYKQYKISMTCNVYTNQPSTLPTNAPEIETTMEEEEPIITTQETTKETNGDENNNEEEAFLGLLPTEWFVILFLVLLILAMIVGLCWYKEYKKDKEMEKEKQTKLTANKGDDDDEIFGANRRSQAPNSPDHAPNRPNGNGLDLGLGRNSRHGTKYVADGDDDMITKRDDSGGFQDVLAKATKSRNVA